MGRYLIFVVEFLSMKYKMERKNESKRERSEKGKRRL
jgi:hypothetical protein